MSDFIGRDVAFGYQKETTRGTKVVDALTWVGKLDFDFKPGVDTIMNESGYSHIAKNSRVDIVRRRGAGGLTSKIFDQAVGHILTMAFGQAPSSAATADSSGDVYAHTYALLNNNSHKSYTLATVEGDVVQKAYPGAILDEVTIDIVTDDYAKISASFLSRDGVAPGSTLTPAYTEENEFLPAHASLKVVAYGGDLDAASVVADVTEAHVTISKNPTDRPTIGTTDVDPRNTVLEVSGEFHFYYNSTTFRDYRDSQTKLALRLAIENTDVEIGDDSSHPSLVLDFPLVQFNDWDADYGADDLVQQTATATMLLDLASGEIMSAVLTNLKTSY